MLYVDMPSCRKLIGSYYLYGSCCVSVCARAGGYWYRRDTDEEQREAMGYLSQFAIGRPVRRDARDTHVAINLLERHPDARRASTEERHG